METALQPIFIRLRELRSGELMEYSVLASLEDGTPEGKSIVELARKMGAVTEKMLRIKWNLSNLRLRPRCRA